MGAVNVGAVDEKRFSASLISVDGKAIPAGKDFDPATDLTIADVNKRADEAMYKDKGLKKDIL